MVALRAAGPRPLLAALVLCAALGVFCYTFAQAVFLGPTEEELPPGVQGPFVRAAPEEYPERLRIPALGVDAYVQDVGIAKSGRMAVPSNYSDAGWYRYGPAPGASGSAVVDGHVDNGFGRLAVFSRLHELKGGEEIVIRNKKGEETRFVVAEVREYAISDVPLERLFSKEGEPRLVLITCKGVYDEETESYDRRLVVYANPFK